MSWTLALNCEFLVNIWKQYIPFMPLDSSNPRSVQKIYFLLVAKTFSGAEVITSSISNRVDIIQLIDCKLST